VGQAQETQEFRRVLLSYFFIHVKVIWNRLKMTVGHSSIPY
jgi:hypothetical protein